MPNGKPGDHALTDILVHGSTVFGRELDDLIREIGQLGGAEELDGDLDLRAFDPRLGGETPDLDDLRRRLVALRDRLRAP